MDVLIFKTNAVSKQDSALIKNHLTKLTDVHECTVDLDDCDKVLRVITGNINAGLIERRVEDLGYYCREMPD